MAPKKNCTPLHIAQVVEAVRKEFTTWPKHLNAFYKITSNALAVEIKASGNAAIGLSRKPAISFNCGYWIVIGEAQHCYITKMKSYHRESFNGNSPGILSAEEFRKFWITWSNGYVSFGRDGHSDAIVSCVNDLNDMKYVTFSVIEQRNPVHWRFELPPSSEKNKFTPIKGGELQWVPYKPDQELPDELLVAGFEKENLYAARAKHRGSLIPGKYVRSLGKAFIPWGGRSTEKPEFEVLCGFDGFWVPTCEDNIPVGAFVAGYLDTTLERLYIGRAMYKGHLITGRVAASQKVCYISYEGKEVALKKYEILVSPEENDRCVNKIFISDQDYAQPDLEDYRGPDSDHSNETDY